MPAVTPSNDSFNLSRNKEKLRVAVLQDKFHEGCYTRQCFLQLVSLLTVTNSAEDWHDYFIG